MTKIATLAVLLGALALSSCKKESCVTPSVNEGTETSIESEQIDNAKKVDFRQKFIGTYIGTSVASTVNGQPTIAGTTFKFIVSKVTTVKNQVKIVVSINNGSPQIYIATASANKLSFNGTNGPANVFQTINMSKLSTSAAATKFTFTTGGGFTGLFSTYVTVVPKKS